MVTLDKGKDALPPDPGEPSANDPRGNQIVEQQQEQKEGLKGRRAEPPEQVVRSADELVDARIPSALLSQALPRPDFRSDGARTVASGSASRFSDVSDKYLLQHAEVDDKARGELFRRHENLLWSAALQITRDPELAEECVGDGFIAAIRHADSFRGKTGVNAWLRLIIVQTCRGRLHALPELEVADRYDYYASTEVRDDGAHESRPETDAQQEWRHTVNARLDAMGALPAGM